MTSKDLACITFASFSLILFGCQSDHASTAANKVEPAEPQSVETDLVWAVNVGGSAYTGIDGTEYVGEESVSGGEIGEMEQVKGSQDALLYKTYREGDIRVAQAIANGIYDITFHFAEPLSAERYAPGDRVFDAFAEDGRVIEDLDVMASRDGKVMSALTVTVPNVVVADGELNIRFEASAGQPTLSALVVRDKNRPAGNWDLAWIDEFDGRRGSGLYGERKESACGGRHANNRGAQGRL